MYKFIFIFIVFLSYSMIGYLCEIVYVSIEQKKFFPNRGFLLGPWLPIYGVGSILMILCLDNYRGDIPVLFCMGVIICSLVEFITSYILEKIFKVRWWDYSKMKYNIDGRICLSNSILFGIGSVIIVQYIEPFYEGILTKINHNIFMIIGYILLFIFASDLITSISVLINLKSKVTKFNKEDNTAEIKNLIYKKLEKHNFLFKRLLNAFPHIEGLKGKELVEFKKMILRIRETGAGVTRSVTKEIKKRSPIKQKSK